MSHQSALAGKDIDAYLERHERKELLRVLICGSVDDGKSTLIGRLLHDSKLIYEDQLAAVRRDSRKSGVVGGQPDLALLVDGLQAEREQGITIDVAWRYFSTDRRKFIIADTPGHEQYTRNMATGASTCDLAIVLIDARQGVKEQTRRHTLIVRLLGIRHIIVAINKMDLVGYDQAVFERIAADYIDGVVPGGIAGKEAAADADCWSAEGLDICCIPVSALKGDNIIGAGEAMPWHRGETLMHRLEHACIHRDRNLEDLRFPVQWVNRPDADFRGYCGTLAAGLVRPGDAVKILPSGARTRVKSIVSHEGELPEAYPPMAATLTLEDDIDVSRGDVIVGGGDDLAPGTAFRAFIVWMGEEPLAQGKEYYIQAAGGSSTCAIRDIGIIDPNAQAMRHLEQTQTEPFSEIPLNGIAIALVETRSALCLDRYPRCRSVGAFILIDRFSNVTVGAGMVCSDPEWAAVDDDPVAVAAHDGAAFGMVGGNARQVAGQLRDLINGIGGRCVVLDVAGDLSPFMGKSPEFGGIVDQLAEQGMLCLIVLDEGHEGTIESLADRVLRIDPAMEIQGMLREILFGASLGNGLSLANAAGLSGESLAALGKRLGADDP